jgi:CcmD family protein
MKNKKSLLALALLFLNNMLFAQTDSNIDMADEMMQNGKIYVVITVLCVVFACIAIYLVLLDRRISKLEKENKK